MNDLPNVTLLLPFIIIGLPLFVMVYFLFKNKSLKAKMIFLYSALVLGVLLLFVNKLFHYLRGEHILAQLPLHLCYISLIFFIPMALITKKKVFYDFIFYINSIGALMALFFPAKDYVSGTFSVITLTYFLFHYIIVIIPLLLFMWKIYSPRINLKQSLLIIGIMVGLSLSMHGLNLLLVKNGVEKANYFWTLTANAKENVGILRLVANIIPISYIYIMTIAAPFLILYIFAWNKSIKLIQARKAKQPLNAI